MKAVIMCNTRTGSTLLYEFINSHPSIFCCDELFAKVSPHDRRRCMFRPYEHYKNKMSVDQYINWISSFNKHFCFKIIPHIHFKNYPDLEKWVRNHMPFIIHLRRNPIPRTVSAFARNKALTTATLEDFKKEIAESKRIDKWIHNTFGKSQQIRYEQIVGEPMEYYGKQYTFATEHLNLQIAQIFDVPIVELYSDMKKELKKDHWSYVKDDIRRRLSE